MGEWCVKPYTSVARLRTKVCVGGHVTLEHRGQPSAVMDGAEPRSSPDHGRAHVMHGAVLCKVVV